MSQKLIYAKWAGIALLALAAFTGVVAKNVLIPFVLFASALVLLGLAYWQALKKFDLWAIDEWARTRASSLGIRHWHPPYHAVEHFCDPNLVLGRNIAASEMNSLMMELIKDPKDNGTKKHAAYDSAKIRHDQFNAQLARSLLQQLVKGDLIAKGLPLEGDVARAERVIPPAQWRILSIDISKAEARGKGWNYSGLVIGKKVDA